MNRDYRPFALLIGLSWTLALTIVGGVVGGVMFDRFMGTSPIGLLVFSLLGILAGSWSVYRQVSAAIDAEEEERLQKKRERETSDTSQGSEPESKEDD